MQNIGVKRERDRERQQEKTRVGEETDVRKVLEGEGGLSEARQKLVGLNRVAYVKRS